MKGGPLCALLHRSSKTVSLTFRSNAPAHSREKSARHSKNIRIKAMGVNHIDFILSYEMNQTTKLPDKVKIVEAGERIFVDRSDTQSIRLCAQRAAILQTRQMDAAASAGVQLPQELHGLALAPTLLETVYD